MNYSNEEIAELINNHPVLKMDKSSLAYEKAFNDMFELAYEMECRLYFKNEIASEIKSRSFGDFTLELRETLAGCLDRYDKERGLFTSYLNFCFGGKRRSKGADMGACIEKDRDEERAINDYLRLIGYSFNDREVRLDHINMIARELSLDPKHVEKIFLKKIKRTVLPEYIQLSEEEAFSLIDENGGTISTEEDYIKRVAEVEVFLEDAQHVYNGLCKSQKEIVRMCFTADYCTAIYNLEEIESSRFSIVSDYILNHYNETGVILNQDQISAVLGKKPPAVCRVYNSFKAKLKEYRKKMER